ncbi:Ion transport peptide-like [Sarcoptes scabiei]|uniref:Ion transport peptide-like n=1 Tax=Sarcoptes scabiei TaxID=52283 RepID=A0A834RCY0_SARSC|nr:Ion transport peptide-like [Sarcoptes scabiei]
MKPDYRESRSSSIPLRMAMMVIIIIVLIVFHQQSDALRSDRSRLSSSPSSSSSFSMQKRSSFSSIGCLGNYDRAKFARLDRICEECFQLYRDPELHTSCRKFCFKNDVFTACIDALMLSHEQNELNSIADEMIG